ncbi:MAG: TIGR03032 family protein [Desulfobulbaceae bacterium]|nr:TIGR03032 family protein [Desulfobulbaceae bacterium]
MNHPKTINTPDNSSNQAVEESPSINYSLSGGLARRLKQLNLSIAFTSYQSNLLYMLGILPNGSVHLHQSAMAKPMGLALDNNGGLVLSTGFQVIELINILKDNEHINKTFNACYLPRTIHLTGALDAHDVGIDVNDRIIFVNTSFNCLATISNRHSFEMVWKPPFISNLVQEDRCHLNGLAMLDGQPAFATAVSRSDTIDGWRDRRDSGGIVIDVQANKIICDGLSMPHSPRIHKGELWVLNAGTGELGVVARSQNNNGLPETGHFEPRVFCPGFLRGLAFQDNFAFVGLSKPRYERFEGLALDQRLKDADSEPWCGIQIIDLEKRCCVDWLRIDGAVSELFDVQIISGSSCPMTISPTSQESTTMITYDNDTLQQQRLPK